MGFVRRSVVDRRQGTHLAPWSVVITVLITEELGGREVVVAREITV